MSNNTELWTQALRGKNKYQVIRLFFDKRITDERVKDKLWVLWRKLNPEQQNPLEMAMNSEWWNVTPKEQLHL